MPEGPEIKFVSEIIKERVVNDIIVSFHILNGPYLTSNKNIYTSQRKKIKNLRYRKCLDVYSKGKYLFFKFNGEMYLAIHAGMAGSWATYKNKHTLFHLEFENEDLYFQDLRRFSKFNLLENEKEYLDFIDNIGCDIFDIDFTTFKTQLLRMKKSKLCSALMNQKRISGIGNYLRADIMYVSKLSPHRLIKELNEDEMCRLYDSCKSVVNESYSCKATTCGNYENTIHYGSYETKVYGKSFTLNGEKIDKFKDVNKRTVWWVPSVQL